jgi:hypothetical protein
MLELKNLGHERGSDAFAPGFPSPDDQQGLPNHYNGRATTVKRCRIRLGMTQFVQSRRF